MYACPEALVLELAAVLFDMPETEDLADAVDATDSFESRRARLYSDGRLGGSEGV